MRYCEIINTGHFRKMTVTESEIGTSRGTSRIWWDSDTGKVIYVPVGENHSNYVATHPEEFNLTSDELGMTSSKDYDGRVLKAAMDKGFIRVRIDPSDPLFNTNVEGTNIRQLRRCVKWLAGEMGEFYRLIVVLRHSEDDKDGTAWELNGMEAVEHFIKFGKAPTRTF